MKKLRKCLVVLLSISLISVVFAKSAALVKVTLSEANVWGTDATLGDGVFAKDGSVTYTAMYRYGGGGYTFKINGKDGIDLKDYATCEIEFDYKTGSWEKPKVMPKFGIKYWGANGNFYSNGQPIDWVDSEALKGTVKRSIDLKGKTGKALYIGVLANSWMWEGNGDGANNGDDTVIITVKSIKFIPKK